ncbi:hypothetical protein AMK22_20220 [Streptomyces sp. CB01580]|nr:hypothetical protein AMK22_20220 [Streptomyces sp. CB01580]
MRLSIFVGCFVVAAIAVHFGLAPSGARDSNFFWVILLSLVLSAPLSYVLLRKQRDEMSAQIAPRIERAKQRLEENRTREDHVAP